MPSIKWKQINITILFVFTTWNHLASAKWLSHYPFVFLNVFVLRRFYLFSRDTAGKGSLVSSWGASCSSPCVPCLLLDYFQFDSIPVWCEEATASQYLSWYHRNVVLPHSEMVIWRAAQLNWETFPEKDRLFNNNHNNNNKTTTTTIIIFSLGWQKQGGGKPEEARLVHVHKHAATV